MINEYNIDEFIEQQSKKMQIKVDELDFGNSFKRQIMFSYETYLKSYIKNLNEYSLDDLRFNKMLNFINDAFIKKVLSIPKDQSNIRAYINYIKGNVNQLDPLYLSYDERNLVFLISSSDFNILNESLVHKGENYLSLLHNLRRLAFKLGYNDKKSEYKPNLAFSDDTVPSAIKDAIKIVTIDMSKPNTIPIKNNSFISPPPKLSFLNIRSPKHLNR